MAAVINAQNLYKRYPGFAPVLRGAGIQVEPGEMVAIMGPSGCGKSTMLHILGLLHAPDSGSLEILGVNALALNREQTAAFRRGNMGFVMQASNLFEHSTVFENVEFPLIYENVPPQERWGRVIRALELVRLSGRVHYPGNRLSGGEQQRVAIARAMVNNPRILLADEPTGALDARTSRLIMDNFRNLCHSGGVAMVMVTHDPAMAEFCDTVYTLADGVLHCQKKGQPPFTENTGGFSLKPPEPLVQGALVASHFPDSQDPDCGELARRLNQLSLLGRIFALRRHFFGDDDAGYSLALPVRRMGFFTRLMALGLFFRRARQSQSLGNLWGKLPVHASGGIGLRRRIASFAAGAVLARWGLRSGSRFFFATSAGEAATTTWVAASLLRLPFAFQVKASDLRRSSANWKIKGQAAAFVLCPSAAILAKAAPLLDIPENRLLLAYPPPVTMPTDEEAEAAQAREPSSHLEIVATGEAWSREGYRTALSACSKLKLTGASFRLTILGKVSGRERRMADKAGLKIETRFPGAPKPDTIAESFKTADIFIACDPDNEAEKLGLPVFLREALIFGVAIVAEGMSEGMAEILNPGENCLAAPAGDADKLAGRLEELGKDAAARARLGASGRKALLNLLDLEAVSRKISDFVVMAAAEKNP